ncbi:MAG TPA: glycosyltransferase family 1 protein [Chitinophagaceae bacterium]|jgi:glycosyltransferase involved in cell wall biosynthesis|nr:glycosyltransferase family 1 protein [Chitinophagaceae bacterium]
MRIAVNTRFLLPDYLEGYGYFIFEIFKYLTTTYPEHQFIFIFDRPYDKRFIFSPNITPFVIGPPARHPLLWKYWYDIKIPSALKKLKADVFVSVDGICSLTTNVPQSLVVHDLAFIHYPSHIKKSHLLFYKRYLPKFLLKAKSISTVSEFSKQDIIDHYKIEKDKIQVVFSAAKEIFKPVSSEIIESIKNKYTDGKEFFLYVGAIHPRKNLVNLLKAFSVFKKRQKSNFKLVLAGRLAWKYDSFIQNLKKYKHRDEVIMLGYLSEDDLVKVTGSAYALVYPSLLEGFGVPVLEAMKCHVPVITSSHSSMQEIAKDAALFVDPQNFEDIAEKMMLIYKDEMLKKQLIEKGKIIAKQYSWQRTAELLWQSILKAVD